MAESSGDSDVPDSLTESSDSESFHSDCSVQTVHSSSGHEDAQSKQLSSKNLRFLRLVLPLARFWRCGFA